MRAILWVLVVAFAQDASELVTAARGGDTVKVRALLADGVDVNGTDTDGRTALMEAAARNDRALVELLLDAGADAGQRDLEGVSALTIAKADGSPTIVALLREHGASESLEELLDEAVRAGDVDAVSRLVDDGADMNALDTAEYQTPLMTALELRELEVFLRLVRAGADPTREGTGLRTSGENAISLAARQGSPWALRLLMESSARQTDRDRALLLGCANAAVVRVALEAGARVNTTGRNDETPLICAASAGSADAVAALLEAGADKSAATADGRTAADWAKLNGFEEIATQLTP